MSWCKFMSPGLNVVRFNLSIVFPASARNCLQRLTSSAERVIFVREVPQPVSNKTARIVFCNFTLEPVCRLFRRLIRVFI
jgi:hypothetical protein